VTERDKMVRSELHQAFGFWLEHDDDSARVTARRLGRHALDSGVPLLELIDSVIRTVTSSAPNGHTPAELLEAGESFMLECLSPYDSALRSALETHHGLRTQNEQMEEQVRRVAHEIHDSSAQFLASVHTELHRVAEMAPAELLPRLQRLQTLLNQVEVDLRRFSTELRPTILDDLGLIPALHELARALGRNGVIVSVEGPADERFPPAAEIALFRTVQEALGGTSRNTGRARRVKIKVETTEHEIRCSIADDGSGSSSSRSSASRRVPGLIAIRERLTALGGSLASENRPDGRGTRLIASIPLEVSHVTSRFDR
jgi:signal transduction histidine kinase